ncbi:MAG: hypothetical protein MK083_02050 [Dehalococcoidia bacterium]|nr:hypothetical protein [Dehalococcoidia bacterium]|tara:strand:+ start:386 stop:784 length:399 start_codon:yes stop_codon:yes gene_type:complete
MKTSIFGISNKTRLIVESIENFCDEIEIFDFIVDYDFTNEQTDKRKIKINIENNLRNNFEILKNNADYIFLASNSDILNSYFYQKIINDFDKNRIQMIISNKDLYGMYKDKNYSVINSLDPNKNELISIIRS